MPIIRLSAHHVRIPLKRTIRHASHSRSETDSLIVRCELNDGSVGWGEGLPRAYVSGETIDDAWSLLQTSDLVEPLTQPIDTLAETIGVLDSLTLCPVDTDAWRRRHHASRDDEGALDGDDEAIARGCFGNSARCAIELAILDAACRREGIPLADVTQRIDEFREISQRTSAVRYSGVITAESPWKQMHSALKQRVYGFRKIKVKVGAHGGDDAAALRRIRRIVGPQVDLRIDANEAWTAESLFDRLAPLMLAGISCVEQPVPHSQIGGLPAVLDDLPVPVMLDESLCSFSDGQRAIDERLGHLFNIRLSKCGGFLPSLRLALLAHQAGLGYQIGCQVGETGILSAAGRHFATSVADIRYLEGSYDRHLVAERLTHEDLTFGYGGKAPAIHRPGLGITVDEAALDRTTVRSEDIIS